MASLSALYRGAVRQYARRLGPGAPVGLLLAALAVGVAGAALPWWSESTTYLSTPSETDGFHLFLGGYVAFSSPTCFCEVGGQGSGGLYASICPLTFSSAYPWASACPSLPATGSALAESRWAVVLGVAGLVAAVAVAAWAVGDRRSSRALRLASPVVSGLAALGLLAGPLLFAVTAGTPSPPMIGHGRARSSVSWARAPKPPTRRSPGRAPMTFATSRGPGVPASVGGS